jgi:hypothetical protein
LLLLVLLLRSDVLLLQLSVSRGEGVTIIADTYG